MKIVFVVLLVINILVIAYIQLGSNVQNNRTIPSLMTPEKIVLLPRQVPCLKWGDFDHAVVHQVESSIAKQMILKTFNIELSNINTMYWVHIPPFMNQQDANREVNKLRNLGIASYRVEEEGPWLNAITLGIFQDQISAQQLLSELKLRGVAAATIKPRKNQQKKIVIHEPDEDVEVKLAHLKQQFIGSKLIQASCDRL